MEKLTVKYYKYMVVAFCLTDLKLCWLERGFKIYHLEYCEHVIALTCIYGTLGRMGLLRCQCSCARSSHCAEIGYYEQVVTAQKNYHFAAI